jgi:phenylalanine-4-hydroxylase
MPGLNDLSTLSLEVLNTMADRPGSLVSVLSVFEKSGLNLTHMESKLHQFSFGGAKFEFDFEGHIDDKRSKDCIQELRELPNVASVKYIPPRTVPWFPTSLKELDEARTTLDGGTALISDDHPGFRDEEYKARRSQIVKNAATHKFGEPIPVVDYTEDEHKTWQTVYARLKDMHDKYACEDFKIAMAKFQRQGVLTEDRIPQQYEVSEVLHGLTGFQIRPVMGLLTARDFLNSLAFRVFWSTQYIRHGSNPYYTPEPDVCHELLGHVPLFANPDFADFSQTIGLTSLGATDAQIELLSTLYWFTVEFGVLSVNGQQKAYGAGLLSSFGELEWSCAPEPSEECMASGGLQAYDAFKDLKRPEIKTLDAEVTSRTAFPISTYQPQYFASPTLQDAKDEVVKFCDTLNKPFFCRYDPFSQRIKVTRSIVRAPPTSTADVQAERQADYFGKLTAGSETEAK